MEVYLIMTNIKNLLIYIPLVNKSSGIWCHVVWQCWCFRWTMEWHFQSHWGWKPQVPPEYWSRATKPHGITLQKTV